MRSIRNKALSALTVGLFACALWLPSSSFASGTVSVSGGTITFSQSGTAHPTLSYSALEAYVFTDANGITAGTGCVQSSSTVATCASAFPRQVTFDSGANIDASVPAGGGVTLVGSSQSPNAVVPIIATGVTGSITTGSAADIITGGDADMFGVVSTGGGSDSITLYTDIPMVSVPSDPEGGAPEEPGEPYVVSTNEFEGETDFWALRVSSGAGGDYIDVSESDGGVYYNHDDGCDLFLGGAGQDWAYHGVGIDDDTLHMGAGDDEVWGYDGNGGDDMTYGGPGNDRYIAAPNLAEEMFDGGPGVDTMQVNSMGGTWLPKPSGTIGRVTLDGVRDDGLDGNDIYTGTVENAGIKSLTDRGAVLIGNAADNKLIGSVGPDTLTGGPGIDYLTGGNGDDTINARDGSADTVQCGGGTDTAIVDAIDILPNPTLCESVQTG